MQGKGLRASGMFQDKGIHINSSGLPNTYYSLLQTTLLHYYTIYKISTTITLTINLKA